MICNDFQATDQSFYQTFINAINKKKLALISDIGCDFAVGKFQPEQIIQSAIKENVNTIMMSPHVDKIHQAIKLAESNQGKWKNF